MKKPAKKAKRIVVDNIEYYWKIARSKFILWGEGFKKVVPLNEFTGWSWDTLERAEYKGYWPEIKPSYVANWIKKNIKEVK